jgi:hypothetical protein
MSDIKLEAHERWQAAQKCGQVIADEPTRPVAKGVAIVGSRAVQGYKDSNASLRRKKEKLHTTLIPQAADNTVEGYI